MTKSTNSVNYAEKFFSSVRGHYASIHGRRPGLSEGALGGKKLSYTLDGLLKLAPSRMRVKMPILQSNMRRIRRVMNLRDSHEDRTMWELCLAQWKGVMRCGDLVKRRAERMTVWDTSKETHRGRIRIEILREGRGNREGVKLELTQSPSKADPTGERGCEKGFVIDRTSQSL